MNTHRDPLDAALDALSREVTPSHDLWARIHADIVKPAVARRSSALWLRLAAGVVLVIASSLVTYLVTRRIAQENVLQAQRAGEVYAPDVQATPASFSVAHAPDADYLRAREALDAEFRRQIVMLPPVTRARLERNLADLRHAANEISATLTEHPSHPLLQELLLSTYQNELALMGSVTGMNVPALTSTPRETRL